MPETDYQTEIDTFAHEAVYHLNLSASRRQRRDELIRDAHAEGVTYYKLSAWSGLSIAQVQRICDLSKDRSE